MAAVTRALALAGSAVSSCARGHVLGHVLRGKTTGARFARALTTTHTSSFGQGDGGGFDDQDGFVDGERDSVLHEMGMIEGVNDPEGAEQVSSSGAVFRQNSLTGSWVVFAGRRRDRPRQLDAKVARTPMEDHPQHDPNCPFCPGNEKYTPPDLKTITDHQGAWTCRVFNNKFPVVSQIAKGQDMNPHARRKFRFNFSLQALGHHEVVVHSRRHNSLLSDCATDTWMLVDAWRDRGRELVKDASVRQVLYFKNHGAGAGASLVHPHAQVVGLPVVPDYVGSQLSFNRKFFQAFGEDAFSMTVDTEQNRQGPSRIVVENDLFMAFVPFAASSPFNVCILPKQPGARFEAIDDLTLKLFADVLQNVLRRIDVTLLQPDYNLVLRSSPVSWRGPQRAFHIGSFFRWYAEVVPRLGAGAMAGFEFGSGMSSNASLPEDDAAALRAANIIDASL
eukprot:m.181745 g.181745  ORF g.181745 m.181745 type:complete len:449 (+) comp18045_c0_seq8:1816-3162(+)